MRMRGLTKREQNWIIHSLKFLIRLVGATTGCLSSSTSRTAKASSCVPPPDHDDLVLLQIVSVKFIEKTYPFTVCTKAFRAQSFTISSEIDYHSRRDKGRE